MPKSERHRISGFNGIKPSRRGRRFFATSDARRNSHLSNARRNAKIISARDHGKQFSGNSVHPHAHVVPIRRHVHGQPNSGELDEFIARAPVLVGEPKQIVPMGPDERSVGIENAYGDTRGFVLGPPPHHLPKRHHLRFAVVVHMRRAGEQSHRLIERDRLRQRPHPQPTRHRFFIRTRDSTRFCNNQITVESFHVPGRPRTNRICDHHLGTGRGNREEVSRRAVGQRQCQLGIEPAHVPATWLVEEISLLIYVHPVIGAHEDPVRCFLFRNHRYCTQVSVVNLVGLRRFRPNIEIGVAGIPQMPREQRNHQESSSYLPSLSASFQHGNQPVAPFANQQKHIRDRDDPPQVERPSRGEQIRRQAQHQHGQENELAFAQRLTQGQDQPDYPERRQRHL